MTGPGLGQPREVYFGMVWRPLPVAGGQANRSWTREGGARSTGRCAEVKGTRGGRLLLSLWQTETTEVSGHQLCLYSSYCI